MKDLKTALMQLAEASPPGWYETGSRARPNIHGLFRYPAMMVPNMQGDLLDALRFYVGKAKLPVVDPFTGSGTMLVEARVRDMPFQGVDINPLAILICEAKLAIDDGCNLNNCIQTIIRNVALDTSPTVEVDFPYLNKWFDEEAIANLSKIRRAIQRIRNQGSRKILWVIFAEVIRLCSNSRTSTYKLHVRKPDKKVDPSVILSVFQQIASESVRMIEEYRALIKPRRKDDTSLICGSSKEIRCIGGLKGHHILATSPPYGDNHTTITYGQFSYLALNWIPEADLPSTGLIGYKNSTQSLDHASIGGSRRDALHKNEAMQIISPSLERFMSQAFKAGKYDQVLKVGSFAYDLFECFANNTPDSNQSAHWLVTTGNRTASGLKVPLDEVFGDIVKFLGGKIVHKVNRKIPNKRLPKKNSMVNLMTSEVATIVEFA